MTQDTDNGQENVETPEQRKPTFSFSALDTYCRCPEAYRRRYLEHEVLPPGIALLKGSGVHQGAEQNGRQKIETHEDLSVKEIVDISVSEFKDRSAQDGISLNVDEEMVGKDKIVGEAIDATARMAKGHAELQAPHYQPYIVEQYCRIMTGAHISHDLTGKIDMIDDKHRVRDWKTASRKKSQGDADVSNQLTWYAAATKILTGIFPSDVGFDLIIDAKKGVARQELTSSRERADFTALIHRMNAVLAAINAGSFPPCLPESWNCSQKFCGYYDTCRFVNNRKAEKKG